MRKTLSALNVAEMDAHGVAGEWSVGDLLGHITTWEAELINVVSSGSQTYYADLDEFNARAVRAKARLTDREILAQLEETHRALRDALAAAPPAYFEPGHPVRKSIDEDTVNHYVEHAAHIRRWARRVAGPAKGA